MIELEKVHYFFKATILSSPSVRIFFKAYKFLKTGVHGKYILVFSIAKFTRLLYLKLMLIQLIKSFHFDSVLSNCLSDIIHYFLTGSTLEFTGLRGSSTMFPEGTFNP